MKRCVRIGLGRRSSEDLIPRLELASARSTDHRALDGARSDVSLRGLSSHSQDGTAY